MPDSLQYVREYPQLFTENLTSIDSERHLLVRYNIFPGGGYTLREAAVRTSLISSLRTLRIQPYEIKSVQVKYAAKIVDIPETAGQNTSQSGSVVFAYPVELFSDAESLTQVLTTLLSGVDYEFVEGFYLDRVISLPKVMVERFHGPRFGIPGIRRTFGVQNRPLLGAVVKPRNGVALKTILEQCRMALRGGMDFLVDDLLMIDPVGELSLRNRVPALSKICHDHKKAYIVNVGSSYRKAIENAIFVSSSGATAIMVNAFAMGIPTMQDLVEELERIGVRIPVITHNLGVGILSRSGLSKLINRDSPGKAVFGVSEFGIASFCRLAGADGIHIGTTGADCFPREDWTPARESLNLPFHKAIPGLGSMAVAEGDLTIANLWDNIRDLGTDVMLEFCTGLYSFPGGVEKGAQAIRKLAEILKSGMEQSEAHNKIVDLADRDGNVRKGLVHFGFDI